MRTMAEPTQNLYSRIEALEKKITGSLDFDIASMHDEVSVTAQSAPGEHASSSKDSVLTSKSLPSKPTREARKLQTSKGSSLVSESTINPSLGVDPALQNVLLAMGNGGNVVSRSNAAPENAQKEMLHPMEPEPPSPSSTHDDDHPGRELMNQLVDNASKSIREAYQTERAPRQSKSRGGKVSIGLCEDVVYVITVQFEVTDEALSLEVDRGDQDDLRTYAVHAIFKVLFEAQVDYRDCFLSDLERCCAAANDFHRLSDWLKEWARELNDAHPYLKLVVTPGKSDRSINLEPNQVEVGELLQLYAADSTYAAQMTYGFAMESVLDSEVKADLFGSRWENKYTSNEVVQHLLRTAEEYRAELELYLDDDILYKKALDALINATIVFYVRCLIQKAMRAHKGTLRLQKREAEKRRLGSALSGDRGSTSARRTFSFVDPVRAAVRAQGDLKLIQFAFEDWTVDIPSLRQSLYEEMKIIQTMCDIIGIAAGVLDSEAEGALDCIEMLYDKANRDGSIVRGFLKDVYYLVVPIEIQSCDILPKAIEAKLNELESNIDPQDAARRLQQTRPSLAPMDVEDSIPGLADVGTLLDNVYGKAAVKERKRTSSSSPGRTPIDLSAAITGLAKTFASLTSEAATVSTAGMTDEATLNTYSDSCHRKSIG